jgi:DNA-binding transcriptional regulator LsrR (DeoR family)
MDGLGLISQVAHMYYNLDMLQPEIARRLFFSRPKISRLLKKARELGVVEIKVRRYLDRVPSLEQRMRSLFGLREAVVLTSGNADPEETLEALTNYAALYVGDLVKDGCTIGITGGETVRRTVLKLPHATCRDIHAVQVIGASANQYIPGEARELVHHIAALYAGHGHYLNVPLYIDDLYAKEILLRDPTVRDVFNYMKDTDIVLTGIGSFDTGGVMPTWFGYMAQRHREELARLGAAGSICAQYFDASGAILECEWNRKCVAIPMEDLKRARMRVAVAAGEHKTLSILGALRGRFADVLITDADTAGQVIFRQETTKPPQRA